MSLSRYPFDDKHKFLVQDPRTDFQSQAFYAVSMGNQRVQYKNFPSQNYSGSEININTTQSRDTAIDSRVYVICKFRVTFTGTPAVGERLVQLGTNDAARFMPLMSVTKTINLTLNEEQFSVSINDYFDALMKYGNSEDELGFDLSGTPSFMDTYQNYSDQALYGSALNPLGNYGENSVQEILRGGFRYDVISGNGLGETSAVIEFETCEPLLISPLTWHSSIASKALIGINTFNISLILESDLKRVWSHSSLGVADLDISSVIINGSPSALFTYIIPKKTLPIPAPQRYPYYVIQRASKTIGTINALDSVSNFISDNQPLQGCPSKIYMFAKRNIGKSFSTTDTYARIDKLNVTFHSADGIFSGFPTQGLYNIARSNGYRRSYQAFVQHEGSVMCIDFKKDVPLLTDEVVAVNENVQFQYEISLTNINPDENINFTLYTIIIYEGVMTIDGFGNITREININSPLDSVDLKALQRLPYQPAVDYYNAGSFGSRIKKVIDTGKKAWQSLSPSTQDIIKDTAKGTLELISPRLAAVAEDYGPAAMDIINKLTGSGLTEDQIYGALMKEVAAGRLKKKKRKKINETTKRR